MEAAHQLLTLGYRPVIVERSGRLGGHVGQWYKLFPDLVPAKDIVNDLVAACKGAEVLLDTTVQSIGRLKDGYNVVLSSGRSIFTKAVLLSTGFSLFDAAKKEEYGYGVYDRVITNRDLENWLGGNPDARIPEHPERIGFVHCVGSRDLKAGNSQCSKVCCMTAIKQAIEMRERFPMAGIYCFYMDLRLFGKKYEDFYIRAQKDYGIHFVRGRVSEVGENIDGNLVVKAEDTLSGKPLRVTMDLLVLMSGMVCNPSAEKIASQVRVEMDSDGFVRSSNNLTALNESGRPGFFLAGACTGTKTVPESLAEARAAALAIHNYLQK